MKKIVGLFLLALFVLYPQLSFAENCNRVCDSSSQIYSSDPDLTETVEYTSFIDMVTDGFNLETNCSIIFSATGSNDDLLVYVYSSLSSTRTGDEVAAWAGSVTNDGTSTQYMVQLGSQRGWGGAFYWIGVASESAADDFELTIDMQPCRYVCQ